VIFSHCLLNKILRHEAIIRAPNVCFELTFTCLIVFKTERSASALTLRFVLERYLVRTWSMMTTLIEVSRDFSLFLRANSGIMPQLRHDHFIPDSLQFVIYQTPHLRRSGEVKRLYNKPCELCVISGFRRGVKVIFTQR